jgi:hypothetical protein
MGRHPRRQQTREAQHGQQDSSQHEQVGREAKVRGAERAPDRTVANHQRQST